MLKKPQNVYMPIDRLQAKVLKRKDPVKKAEWVDNFVLALSEEAEDPFAKELLEKAQFDYYKDTLRTWRLKAKKSLSFNGNEPSEKQIHEWCCEEYGDEYLEALNLLSKNSKRFSKKIQNLLSNKSNDQGTTEISTNNAGNPLTEESATSGQKTDNPLDAGDAALGDRAEATTTVSGKPIAKDADTRKDSENVNGTVNGVTMESSTSFAQFKGADATTRKGVGNTTPVGDYGTSESATSAPTLFLAPARGSGKPKAAGRVHHPSSLPSPAADGPAKHPYGEFQNVMLTTEEFQKFVTSEGAQRANGLIEELSSYIASSGKRYKSHYATLLNWARRKKDEETPKQRYMTADDISRRNAEEGWRQLQLMHNQGNG